MYACVHGYVILCICVVCGRASLHNRRRRKDVWFAFNYSAKSRVLTCIQHLSAPSKKQLILCMPLV